MNEQQKARLRQAAQATLKDERHWSVVGSEDRAENGKDLANTILDLLGIAEDPCPAGCKECKEHQENVGE